MNLSVSLLLAQALCAASEPSTPSTHFAHGTLLLIYGARKAELSKIMPFDYIEIFFALILGWIFFAEWPVDQLFPGTFFIVLGGLIIYLQQRKNNFQRLRKT